MPRAARRGARRGRRVTSRARWPTRSRARRRRGDRRRARGGRLDQRGLRVELADGGRAFVKTRADAAPGEYADRGRRPALAGASRARSRVPEVLRRRRRRPRFLALEWIDAGRLDAAGEEELGRGLAALHAAGAPAFGAPPPARAAAPRCASARSRCPTTRAADWPRVLRRAAAARRWSRCARRAARCRRRRARRRARVRADRRARRARPSRPRACTATCGAATSWPAPTGAPG